jgi:hypothetical protein
MKNPTIGERVRVYDSGISTTGGHLDGIISKIEGVSVCLDFGTPGSRWFDRRQCVRLVKKKNPRQWWINLRGVSNWIDNPDGTTLRTTPPGNFPGKWIRVREVKK